MQQEFKSQICHFRHFLCRNDSLHVWQCVNHQPPGGQRSKRCADSRVEAAERGESNVSEQVEVQVWSNRTVVDGHVCYCKDEILEIFSSPARLTQTEWLCRVWTQRRSLTHKRESVSCRVVFGFLFSFFSTAGCVEYSHVIIGLWRRAAHCGDVRTPDVNLMFIMRKSLFVFRNASAALNIEQQLVMKPSQFISPERSKYDHEWEDWLTGSDSNLSVFEKS